MEEAPKKILNINLGILGHIDSGKTSLGTICACNHNHHNHHNHHNNSKGVVHHRVDRGVR